MSFKRTIILICAIAFLSAMTVAVFSCASTGGTTQTRDGMWVIGDFHTHTYISDGEYRAAEVAAKAVEYGLDWYSATDHGGVFDRNDAGEVVGNRFRWETILGEGSDRVHENRRLILQFNGFEYNPPGHEHASVAIIGDPDVIRINLALFHYLFDAVDSSTYNDLTPEMRTIVDASGIPKNTVNNH
jgi:hypothetical protein